MVASADLGYWIGLADLYERARVPASRLIYEPEQFPAAIYRTENPQETFEKFTASLVEGLRQLSTPS